MKEIMYARSGHRVLFLCVNCGYFWSFKLIELNIQKCYLAIQGEFGSGSCQK